MPDIMVAMKRHGQSCFFKFLKYRNLHSANLILHLLLERGKQSQAGLETLRQFMCSYIPPISLSPTSPFFQK